MTTGPSKTPQVSVAKAMGRPIPSWVGKRPLGRVTAYPAHKIERFAATEALSPPAQVSITNWCVNG